VEKEERSARKPWRPTPRGKEVEILARGTEKEDPTRRKPHKKLTSNPKQHRETFLSKTTIEP